MVAQRDRILIVRFRVDRSASPATAFVEDDRTHKIQDGARPAAYRAMHEWIIAYLADHAPCDVVVKASAVSGKGSATLGLLESAELRGVAICAAMCSGCRVHLASKAVASRTFGERKVDEYVGDDDYCNTRFIGELKKGSREAMVLAYACATGGT